MATSLKPSPGHLLRRVRIGCEFVYEAPAPIPSVFMVQPRSDLNGRVLSPTWESEPPVDVSDFTDIYGNTGRRLTLPVGRSVLRYDAVAEVPADWDEIDEGARLAPVEELPSPTLLYTLPSRYCQSDLLADMAWDLFGDTEAGWARVQTICDWVHGNITFQNGASTPFTTAADVVQAGVGVCRDFAHVAVALCRAMNVPARYAFGYLPDIGPSTPGPMDFCAWFEVYLGGRWLTFDARNNVRRTGRVLIGLGRDALDVAMVTTWGRHRLDTMTVWADEVLQSGATEAEK